MIKKTLLAIAFALATTPAFATTTTSPSNPTAPITPEVSICENGPSWAQAGEDFIKRAEAVGGRYIGEFMEADGSFAQIFDLRTVEGSNPETPILVLIFDPRGCNIFVTNVSEVTLYEVYGSRVVGN